MNKEVNPFKGFDEEIQLLREKFCEDFFGQAFQKLIAILNSELNEIIEKPIEPEPPK